MQPNKYRGKCEECQATVQKGEGTVHQNSAGIWKVRCQAHGKSDTQLKAEADQRAVADYVHVGMHGADDRGVGR